MAFTYFAHEKKNFIELTADTNCSFIEAVDELFQQSSADELMEIMSTPLLSAYCLFCFEKKKIFSVFAADAFGSFREAVDELFQHPFVDECKEIMSILLSNAYCLFCFKKKVDF